MTAGGDAGGLPFGQKNRYEFGISAAQTVFAGGRLASGYRMSSSVLRIAQRFSVNQAAVTLDLTQAYYDALLADSRRSRSRHEIG